MNYKIGETYDRKITSLNHFHDAEMLTEHLLDMLINLIIPAT